MISHYRRLDCFIIKRINYAEKDRIITVFSRQKGKLTLIAKGIRKINSKRSSALELFNKVSLLSYKTGGLDLITEVNLIKSYANFAKDYQKTYIIYQIAELIDKLTAEKEPSPELFFLIDKAFQYVNQKEIPKEKVEEVVIRFKIRILELLGFGIPQSKDTESLTIFIENIIEKKLLVKNSLKI